MRRVGSGDLVDLEELSRYGGDPTCGPEAWCWTRGVGSQPEVVTTPGG